MAISIGLDASVLKNRIYICVCSYKNTRRYAQQKGSVAEWSIAPVLKTGNGKPFVSSNLTASANKKTAFLLGCFVFRVNQKYFCVDLCGINLCVPAAAGVKFYVYCRDALRAVGNQQLKNKNYLACALGGVFVRLLAIGLNQFQEKKHRHRIVVLFL